MAIAKDGNDVGRGYGRNGIPPIYTTYVRYLPTGHLSVIDDTQINHMQRSSDPLQLEQHDRAYLRYVGFAAPQDFGYLGYEITDGTEILLPGYFHYFG